MAKVKQESTSSKSRPKMRPAMTEEGREKQMVSLAIDLAEQQLRDGTASSQVITHYLKLGSTRERLEREKLEEENRLLKAKTKAIADEGEIKAMYDAAIKAFRGYRGESDRDEY